MSNTSYKQIIPATDWYFRHDNVSGVAGKSTVYQLAAWALKENGEVVGTVAKLAMRQPFVLFKGLTFQKLCLP
ncbi:hypothetical protein OU658_06290, partial [Escherichia coli]|nr:hypothetical protein [Escherichia coli]MDF8708957.1 hypothetical protein [Escherichia coli]